MDTETTGFGRYAEIIQIAAKRAGANGSKFSAYAYPEGGIERKATETHGLQMVDGQLQLRGVNVRATSLNSAMKAFVEFLQKQQKRITLVAHNGFRFDFPLIYLALRHFNLLQPFGEVVCGFTDTLVIFRSDKAIKERELKLSLAFLAKKYLPNCMPEEAHEALSDCITLETICEIFNCTNRLIPPILPTVEFINIQELMQLRFVLTVDMRKRLARSGLSMSKLQEAYRAGKHESIRMLLGELNELGNPKDKRIIAKLCDFLQSLQDNESETSE